MIWYLTKLHIIPPDVSDPDPEQWTAEKLRVGFGNPTEEWTGRARYVVQAHDRAAGTCLVGLKVQVVVPDDWTLLSLVDARASFEVTMGRPPTAKEIR